MSTALELQYYEGPLLLRKESLIAELNTCFCTFSVLRNRKDDMVNQQAEGKTHFNRLSCETDWRHEALLCLPEALFSKSPIWSTVP